jgi:hypothetical protein
MSIELLPILMGVGRTALPTCTLSTVRITHEYVCKGADRVGIDDHLAQRLTNSLPPDVLRAFVELYCDVLRKPQESIFSESAASDLDSC